MDRFKSYLLKGAAHNKKAEEPSDPDPYVLPDSYFTNSSGQSQKEGEIVKEIGPLSPAGSDDLGISSDLVLKIQSQNYMLDMYCALYYGFLILSINRIAMVTRLILLQVFML